MIKNSLIILLLVLVLLGCQTGRKLEKIVISDTTKFVIIDTTHIKIVDSFRVINTIDSVVFDTLYNFVDSVVVREVLHNALLSVRNEFYYDTNLAIAGNKLLRLRVHYYDDSIRIEHDLKQLISHEIHRERVEKEELQEWFPSLWVQISIGVVLFLLLLCFILYKLNKRN